MFCKGCLGKATFLLKALGEQTPPSSSGRTWHLFTHCFGHHLASTFWVWVAVSFPSYKTLIRAIICDIPVQSHPNLTDSTCNYLSSKQSHSKTREINQWPEVHAYFAYRKPWFDPWHHIFSGRKPWALTWSSFWEPKGVIQKQTNKTHAKELEFRSPSQLLETHSSITITTSSAFTWFSERNLAHWIPRENMSQVLWPEK